jgi:hypothetical protein
MKAYACKEDTVNRPIWLCGPLSPFRIVHRHVHARAQATPWSISFVTDVFAIHTRYKTVYVGFKI